MSDEPKYNSWVIGCVLSITGNLMINWSANMLKWAHAHKTQFTRRCCAITPSRLSWTGSMILFVVGNILNFVSFAYAAQTMLSALSSVQFVSNVVVAAAVLGEPITPFTLVGTALIVVGNLVVVIWSSHADISYDVRDLQQIFTGSAYGWFILGAIISVILLLAAQIFLSRRYSITAKDFTDDNHNASFVILQSYGFIYVLVSGVVGTQSVTYAKALSILGRLVISGETQWMTRLFPYLVTLAWFGCMVFWMIRRTRVLLMFDSMFIVPVLQVVWIVLSVVQGAVFFNELSDFTKLQAVMFSFGMLILFIGVAIIAKQSPEPEPIEEDPADPLVKTPTKEASAAPDSEKSDDLSGYESLRASSASFIRDLRSQLTNTSFVDGALLGFGTSMPMRLHTTSTRGGHRRGSG
eukprot:NODE_548_length_1558_cov_314.976143_g412_i0.p1 GENE.NODE_548_length_1558_cov_314.976143_g412_i0~~NODE_548_length_1558_cov_314.976143_g412_i0.p1  ORF type:complete len:409 (-),score=61.14 NODE_548_length_1558_cov_314.976143_g412_i0:193-1419(-)